MTQEQDNSSGAGQGVIVVDDGLATGATMRAAVAAIRRQQPARVVVAVPVGAASTCRELQQAAQEVVCASAPALFVAVGQAYRDFAQTTDGRSVPCWTQPRRLRTTRPPVPDRVRLPGSATGERCKRWMDGRTQI